MSLVLVDVELRRDGPAARIAPATSPLQRRDVPVVAKTRPTLRGRALPRGTGKTLAAEVLASRLDLELYRVDLDGVVSRYVGETEKNLARILEAAETVDGILILDEADALFGRRTDVRDAHDRYANVEVDHLVRRGREHGRLVVLAPSLSAVADEAVARRLGVATRLPLVEADRLRRPPRTASPPPPPPPR